MRHIYRHLQIRYFSVGPFAFENFILKIENDADKAVFESLLEQLPVMYKHAIVNVTQPSDQDGESGGSFGLDENMPASIPSGLAGLLGETTPTVEGTASATTVQPLPVSGGSTVQGSLETSKIPDPTTTTTSTTPTKA